MVSHRVQSWIAALLLVAYTVTGTSLLPGLVSLAAMIDGSHELLIAEASTGTTLTLHHRPDDFTPRATDHSNTAARVLTAFCAIDSKGDHRLSTSRLKSLCTSPAESAHAPSLAAKAVVENEQATILLATTLRLAPQDFGEQIAAPTTGMVPLLPLMERLSTVQILV